MDCDDVAVLDEAKDAGQLQTTNEASPVPSAPAPPSPVTKARSLSDGGGSTPSRGRLSPSPLLLASSSRRTCRDDSSIGSSSIDVAPVTPRRQPFQYRGLSLQPHPDPQQSAHQQDQQQDQKRDQQHGRQQPQQQSEPLPQQQQTQQHHSQMQKDPTPSTPVSSGSTHLKHQLLEQQEQLFLNQPMYITKPIPLSPKLDPSQIYASPTNILPRRSRGLDFSRAATSLHHSTLAEQSSPDSSPTTASGRAAMNIPGRRAGDYSGATESSSSLWSMMGRSQDKTYPSSSLGSVNNMCSDLSSSSEDDDLMDEDMEEPFVTTPQVGKVATPTMSNSPQTVMPWMPGSPAMNSLLSFQQRQRPRKQPKRKIRGPLGLGFSSISASSAAAVANSGSSTLSRSPPAYILGRDVSTASQPAHTRRESISWAANQLHISGSESDDNIKSQMEARDGLATTPGRDGQRGVIRRAVTRRGNLLPKTKGFARIRAALAEESAPVEAEFRREAEVVRQVLESDTEPDYRHLPPLPPLKSTATTANSSPCLLDNIDDLSDDVMAMDASAGLGLSSAFIRHGETKPKSRHPWGTFDPPSGGGVSRPSPPQQVRVPSSGVADDVSMDSPVASSSQSRADRHSHSQGPQHPGLQSSNIMFPNGAIFPMTTTTSSSGGGTPQHGQAHGNLQQPLLPSAAEITRRINSKRRRDDDLDPVSFKRRAVSPGMSVHNSPIMQSPLQRDVAPWGPASSRPGSNSGSSEAKFLLFPQLGGGNGSFGSGSENGTSGGGSSSSGGRVGGNKGRVGYQAMADTNDSITRLSIE